MSHAASTHEQHRKRRHWLGAVLLLGLLCLGGMVWHSLSRSGPQPVFATSLEPTLLQRWLHGRAWRDLPFTLSRQEEDELKACEELGQRVNSTVDGVVEFTKDEVRRDLEELLRGAPHLFHAEYLLGLWYEMKHRPEESRAYYRRSREHAPVTLVVRYEFSNGQPLAGAVIGQLAVECNRVQNGWLDPSLELRFHELTTDESGCVYLPVYDTVYRLSSASDPRGFAADYPTLGHFGVRGRIGLLPPVRVRPQR